MSREDEAPALLKDLLGPAALQVIADAGKAASRRFDRAAFLAAASDGLAALSIMERVRHIAGALHRALPTDYLTALAVVRAMGPRLTHAFQAMAVTEYVARFGLGEIDASLEAIADLTRHGTGEFAIRPFLVADPARTLGQMQRWALHPDEHVRRLASEGSRPRLPWAARVPALRDDPTLAAPILDALRSDPSMYVRKSVANHLNDISRDRPDWVVERLAGWSQDDAATRWIVRHALRTLIKRGDARALALVGAGGVTRVEVTSFVVSPVVVTLGEAITLEAALVSRSETAQKLVVDYGVHYVRARGKTANKVFKWKTFVLEPGATATLVTRQVIRDLSTRRHYPGVHQVDLLVNGATLAQGRFELRGESQGRPGR